MQENHENAPQPVLGSSPSPLARQISEVFSRENISASEQRSPLPGRHIQVKRTPMPKKKYVRKRKNSSLAGKATAPRNYASSGVTYYSGNPMVPNGQRMPLLKPEMPEIKKPGPIGRPRTVGRPPLGGVNVAARMVQSAKKTQTARKTQTTKAIPSQRFFQSVVSPATSYRSTASHNSSMTENMKADLYKLSMHINIVSGFSKLFQKPNEHAVYREHTYSKPHNWLPEHVYVKPTRYLFSEKPSSPQFMKPENMACDEVLDIEIVDKQHTLPQIESWKVANVFGSLTSLNQDTSTMIAEMENAGEDNPSWEEKIAREGWSAGQTRLFNNIVTTLDAIELRALVCRGSPSEFITMGTTYDLYANDFRYHLINCHYDLRIPIWLHGLLNEHLPPEFKKHYKELLARVKLSIPYVVDSMVKATLLITAAGRLAAANTAPNIDLPILEDDPVADQLIREKFKRLPRNPIFLVVPDDHRMYKKYRYLLFTTMLNQMGQTFTVSITQAPDGSSVQQGLDHRMAQTRSKLTEIRGKLGNNRDVILIGFNTGGALATLLALIEPVYAVISLGFPMSTIRGARGQPNDAILNIRCPLLFFIGEHSNTASVPQMESMRSRMSVYTQLVVMGKCDDSLVMPRQRMLDLSVTQAMVDKSILVEIHTFLGQMLTNPAGTSIAPRPVVPQPSQKRQRTTSEGTEDGKCVKQPTRKYVKKQQGKMQIQGGRKARASNLTSPGKMAIAAANFLETQPKHRHLPPHRQMPSPEIPSKLLESPPSSSPKKPPGLWQSKYKSPMLSPVKDKNRPQIQRVLNYKSPTPPSPTPVTTSQHPTSVFVTPSVPSLSSTPAITTQSVQVSSASGSPSCLIRRQGSSATGQSIVSTGLLPITSRTEVNTNLMTVLASRPARSKVVLLGDGTTGSSPVHLPASTISSVGKLTIKPSQIITVTPGRRKTPYSPQPLTADNILNLPIIFAKDDDNIFQMGKPCENLSSLPSTSPSPSVVYSQSSGMSPLADLAASLEEEAKPAEPHRIINKFEFSKPQPGVKYRKIFLTRQGSGASPSSMALNRPGFRTISIHPDSSVPVRPRVVARTQTRMVRPANAPKLLGPLKHATAGRPSLQHVRSPALGRPANRKSPIRHVAPPEHNDHDYEVVLDDVGMASVMRGMKSQSSPSGT